MVRPFALQAGDERTFERRMGFLLEQIHQRRAGECILAGIAEQLQPRSVGIDDDALLHVRDGVGRALEEILQLLAILARRGQRRRQGAFQAIRAQLPGDDRLQAAAVGERDHVLGAEAHRIGDRGLIDVLPHDQHRHLGGVLLLHLHDRGEVDSELIDEGDQHLGIELRQGVPQVARIRQPGAVHRMAGLAQRAVDCLDVVLRPRHDDHWDGALFTHWSNSSPWQNLKGCEV